MTWVEISAHKTKSVNFEWQTILSLDYILAPQKHLATPFYAMILNNIHSFTLKVYGFNFSSVSGLFQSERKWANQNTNLSQVLSSTKYKMPMYFFLFNVALFASLQ